MSKTEQKQGRGRPVGTFSYAMIGAAELPKIAKIKGFLPVSKRYLKSIGVDVSAFSDFTGAVEPAKEVKTPKAKTQVIKPVAKAKPKAKAKAKTATEEPQIQATLEA
jgi:hypothetical protein